MNLRLIREPSALGTTLGVLFVDGHYECFTLEDELREDKIPGETAIPPGRYRVVITPSQRFQRDMPLLMNVPGFAGVRIHSGNVAADTEGCILVGRDRGVGMVLQSRVAFASLFAKLEAALAAKTTAVWLTIENPEPAS